MIKLKILKDNYILNDINNYFYILLVMTILYSHKIGFTYEYFVLDQIKKDFDKVWHWKDFP